MKLKLPKPYEKQTEFLKSKARYIAYGGARGGGKSYAARLKAALLCLNYDGIQILLLRRTLKELRENHVLYLRKMLYGVAEYKEINKEFIFPNGSRLVLGYCDAEADVLQYQGQAYDAVFMEEATHFSEFQFRTLTESNRTSGMCVKKFAPKMFLTCNPGGVGHTWVKRLFIDRNYTDSENPEDYEMIRASVYDNKFLTSGGSEYIKTLESLPEQRKRAMLHGDWDIFAGQFFSEFRRNIHVIKPFDIPGHYTKYVSIDYGLDMLAAYEIALDGLNNAYITKEIYKSGLIVSQACDLIKTIADDSCVCVFAPPDLFSRHSDSGKSTADIFCEKGVPVVRADADRKSGWLSLKEWLKPVKNELGETTSRLKIFENCANLIRTLPQLIFDDKDPADCSREPHELTHAPDAIRYFFAGRHASAAPLNAPEQDWFNEQTQNFLRYGA